MEEQMSSQQKRYEEQKKFIKEQIDRQKQVDERNERNEMLIKELRVTRINHEQNPMRKKEESIHSERDRQHASHDNENLVDDVYMYDRDDNYDDDYKDNYSYSSQNTM